MNSDRIDRRVETLVLVTEEPIDHEELVRFVADSTAGSIVTFSGTARDHSPGKSGVTELEYEAYGEVVEAKIREIVDEACDRWPVIKAAAVHRTGVLEIGESAVVVAVSTAHRVDGFPAARYIIDELKGRAPIWKKEHWPGGAEWSEGA